MGSLTLALLLVVGCASGPEAPETGPGVPFRRLSRSELRRAVGELVGRELPAVEQVPLDDPAGGFDTTADGLAVSPLLVERWYAVADEAAREIVRRPGDGEVDLVLDGTTDGLTVFGRPFFGDDGAIQLATGGSGVGWTVVTPVAGAYVLTFTAWASSTDGAEVRAGLRVDGVDVASLIIPTDTMGGQLSFEVDLPRGAEVVSVVLVGDDPDPDRPTRSLSLRDLRLRGPLGVTAPPALARARWVPCDPPMHDARRCAQDVLEGLLPWAWRQPVAPADVEPLLAVVDGALAAGSDGDEALRAAITAALLDPRFLFHVEPEGGATLPGWAVANRMAWFLWQAPPDEALRTLGDRLVTDAGLRRDQARRMLRDPRADGLLDALADQWLGGAQIRNAVPDPTRFPELTQEVRDAMAAEHRRFVASFIGTSRPLTDLLLAEEGYADATLGVWYGVDIDGEDLTGFPALPLGRGGLLGQGGLQLALSLPDRTSPVRRGVWVLTQLLCDAPDPPPASVPGFPEASPDAATVRERLEQHRADPACAGCHDAIDPIGLAMEAFDAVGRFRTADEGVPVRTDGRLPGGRVVDGLVDLNRALAADPRSTACMVDRLFTLGHQRTAGPADRAALAAAERGFLLGGASLDALVAEIVSMPSFITPRGAP